MSALREMLIKIGIISDTEGAKEVEQALDDTAAAAQKVDDTVGDAAGGAEKLAGAVEKIGDAGAKAAEPMSDTAEAAGELGREAGPAAGPTGELAEQLENAATKVGVIALVFGAARKAWSTVFELIREHIELLKQEKTAIEEQQNLNLVGSIEGTKEAIRRLCEEYDTLNGKRERDYNAVKRQLEVDLEYELAVNERDMRKEIAADPENESNIREKYSERGMQIKLSSDRAKLNADLDLAEKTKKDAEAKAADAADAEARTVAKQNAAQKDMNDLYAKYAAEIDKAQSRTPLLSWKRLGLGSGFVDAIYDAPRNRMKRESNVVDEFKPKLETSVDTASKATDLAREAKRVREEAERAVEDAERNRELLMQRRVTQMIREESASIGFDPTSVKKRQSPASGFGPASAQGGAAAGPTNDRTANEMKRANDNIEGMSEAFTEIVRNLMTNTDRLRREAEDLAARTKQPGG